MIPALVVTVVIVVALVAPSALDAAARRRRRPAGSRLGDGPDWWPQFEREFRAYVRARDDRRRSSERAWRWNDGE